MFFLNRLCISLASFLDIPKVEIVPTHSGSLVSVYNNQKYVLKYEINKAQGADYKTLIDNLEELKEQEFSEEWGFELAYLYHQAGMGDKCIECCDTYNGGSRNCFS